MVGRVAADPQRVNTLSDLTRELDVLRRLAAGPGQVQLAVRDIAKRTGKAPSTLDPYLRGQRLCPEDTFEEILCALGVPTDQLGPWLDAWERVAEGRSRRTTPLPDEAAAVISGLPRPDSQFIGRQQELSDLVAELTSRQGPRICTLYGFGGVGKTALAMRAAALVGDRVPGGPIFIDLHGYTVERAPLTSMEALDRLLRRLGVDGEQIPEALDERSALWRSLVGDRQMLIVLDNARDVTQVQPLLPAATDCMVIVTSRRRLAALDDAYALPLDPMDHHDAVALFRAVAGPERIDDDPGAEDTIGRIIGWCGRIPLAVRIAAARHRASRVQTLAELERRLSVTHMRFAALDDEDRSVASSFHLSLIELPAATRRMFALLAVLPGTDIDLTAAAALADETMAETIRNIQRLVDRYLLTEHASGRYRRHDLIAVFAREYALGPIPHAERAEALRRVIDYYLLSADVADRLITPGRFRVPLEVADRQTILPELPDYEAALEWLNVEQGNLVDACLAAGETGLDSACWQLAHTLRGYYFLTKHWQPWLTTHEAALEAARRVGDPRAEAMITNNIGLAKFEQGQHEDAAEHYRDALHLFTRIGDRSGEHTARANLAWVLFTQEQYAKFLREMKPVVEFYRKTGSHRNAAITERGMGLALAALGRTAEAADSLQQALAAFVDLDLRLDIAMTLNGLGETLHLGGELPLSVDAYTRALSASERCGSRFERARAHHGLGQLAAQHADWEQAREHWELALADYRILGAPQAADVQALLDSKSR